MIGMDDPSEEPTWKDALVWLGITGVIIVAVVFLLNVNPYQDDPRWQAISLIPQDASVAADQFLITQLSSRKTINYFYTDYAEFDYVIIDLSRPEHRSVTHPELRRKLVNDPQFELIFSRHPAFLFRNKNYEVKE